VQRIPGDNVRIVLRVVIKEAPDVPLLTEPLSQTDEALLRFRQWFLTAGDNVRRRGRKYPRSIF